MYSVYIIAGPTGRPVKVGRANDVQKRLSALQTGNPYQLAVYYEHSGLEAIEAVELEKGLHKALSQYRLKGEWFDVHANSAIWDLKVATDSRAEAARVLLKFIDERNCEEHGIQAANIPIMRDIANGRHLQA